jgi:potassium-transporting ATPase potassium-binding subunit
VPPLMILVMTSLAVTLPSGLTSIFNPGPHGFTEALYAYTSQGNNNGSAFAGYGATTFSTLLGGAAMLLARFVPLVAALAVAGALAARRSAPASAGTFRTDSPTFAAVLVAVVVIVSGLTIFPALALGPIVEALKAGTF